MPKVCLCTVSSMSNTMLILSDRTWLMLLHRCGRVYFMHRLRCSPCRLALQLLCQGALQDRVGQHRVMSVYVLSTRSYKHPAILTLSSVPNQSRLPDPLALPDCQSTVSQSRSCLTLGSQLSQYFPQLSDVPLRTLSESSRSSYRRLMTHECMRHALIWFRGAFQLCRKISESEICNPLNLYASSI